MAASPELEGELSTTRLLRFRSNVHRAQSIMVLSVSAFAERATRRSFVILQIVR
jgi:hypothetical protein